MSGNRFLLDTNAVIALLKGNKHLLLLLNSAAWIGVSIISRLEFLSFSGITNDDINLFDKFLQKVDIIDLCNDENNLISRVIEFRKTYNIKLPDAIIAGSAHYANAVLISKDKSFGKIKSLKVLYNWN